MNWTEIGVYVGTFCAIVVGYFTTRHVNGSARDAGSRDPGMNAWQTLADILARLTAAENEVKSLRTDLGTERDHSRGQDDAIKALEQQMARAVRHIRDFWAWIDRGAQPPPPTRPDWLAGLPGWADTPDDDN
jgi:hypothetical protein